MKGIASVVVFVLFASVVAAAAPQIDPVSKDLVAVYGVERKTEIGPSDTELLAILFSERELKVWSTYFEQHGTVKSWMTLAEITYSIDYSAYSVELDTQQRNLVTARDIETLSMFFDLIIGVPVPADE